MGSKFREKVKVGVDETGQPMYVWVNASTKEYPIAYTMLELGSDPDEELINAIQHQKHVVRVRAIPSKTV